MKENVHDQDTLIRLIDRLNSYPIGLPDSPEIREFLSLFLAPEEVELAASFPLREATVNELAARQRWDETRTEEILENMAQKGAVVDYRLDDKTYWILTPSVIGFVEFSLMKTGDGEKLKRLAQLLDRYEEDVFWKELFGSATPLTRALVGQHIPVHSEVVDYARVEKIVAHYEFGAVQTCFCRHKAHLLGRSCTIAYHEETCFSLGQAADFTIRRGFARRVEIDQLLTMIKALGEKGLIHITDNVRNKPTFICNCCGCCCGLLSGINKYGVMGSVAPTPYVMSVDKEACVGCEACAKKCQVHAITVVGKKACIDEERCLGCGACMQFCSRTALSLRRRQRSPHLPHNQITKYIRIAYQKGRLFKLLKDALRSKMYKMM